MEKTKLSNIKYNKDGLVPVLVQEDSSNEILMFAYSNEEAIKLTFEKKFAYFWSRSRNELWLKGHTSGNFLKITRILIDCDNDSLVYKVDLNGNKACHTGNKTCFYKELTDE